MIKARWMQVSGVLLFLVGMFLVNACGAGEEKIYAYHFSPSGWEFGADGVSNQDYLENAKQIGLPSTVINNSPMANRGEVIYYRTREIPDYHFRNKNGEDAVGATIYTVMPTSMRGRFLLRDVGTDGILDGIAIESKSLTGHLIVWVTFDGGEPVKEYVDFFPYEKGYLPSQVADELFRLGELYFSSVSAVQIATQNTR